MPYPSKATQFKSGAQAALMGRKGGLSTSIKKSIGARLRALKQKGLTKELEKHLVQLLENKDICHLDILIAIQKMQKENMTVQERQLFVGALQRWSDSVHGRKDTSQVQINVQQNFWSVEEKEELLKELLKEEV